MPAPDRNPRDEKSPATAGRAGERPTERDATHQGAQTKDRDAGDANQEHSFTSGPKADPAAPGASNNGDLGRRMFAGETPAGAETDERTEHEKHEEWPTVGTKPGTENLPDESIPQGEAVRENKP